MALDLPPPPPAIVQFVASSWFTPGWLFSTEVEEEPAAPEEPIAQEEEVVATEPPVQEEAAQEVVTSPYTGKQSVYIDMGILYGNYVMSNCMNWQKNPPIIKPKPLNKLLKPMFTKLQSEGIDQINLAFAQLTNIPALLQGSGGDPTRDTIDQIFNPPAPQEGPYIVGKSGQNFLGYLINYAKKFGISTDLSFGGAIATESDMNLGAVPGATGEKLGLFMQGYNFGAVDYDLESDALITGNPEGGPVEFMQSAFSTLTSQGQTSTLTVLGAYTSGPEGALAPLFQDIETMFDGVNLMLYSNSEYYLDAVNASWGLKGWLDNYIPKPEMLHVGFYDAIAYEDPAASAGEKYDVPSGLTRGQAAAWVYIHVLSEMGLTPNDVGAPFWWTDNPTTLPANDVLSDFYAYLASNG